MRNPAAIYQIIDLPNKEAKINWSPEKFEDNIKRIKEKTGFSAAAAGTLLENAMKPKARAELSDYMSGKRITREDFYSRIDRGEPGIPPKPNPSAAAPKQELPPQARTLKPPARSYGIGM